jgi:hypothetical protein
MSARGLDSTRSDAPRTLDSSIRPLHDGQLDAAQAVRRPLPGTASPQSPAYKSFRAWTQPFLSPLSQISTFLSPSPPSVSAHPDPQHLLGLDILLKTFSHPLAPCSGTCGKDGGRREHAPL